MRKSKASYEEWNLGSLKKIENSSTENELYIARIQMKT